MLALCNMRRRGTWGSRSRVILLQATPEKEEHSQGLHLGCPGQLNLARSVASEPWALRPQGGLERLTFVSSGALEV